MKIYRGLQPRLMPATARCVTLGNFDGVHRGHQALIARLREQARAMGSESMVITFEPLPQAFFRPQSPPPRITRPAERLHWLRQLGVDAVWLMPFNKRLAAMSAEQFANEVLFQRAGARHVVLGDDLRFGKARRGDINLLQQLAAPLGVTAEALPTQMDIDGQRISSTAIRAALQAGYLQAAQRLLGRAYCISGRVMHGKKLGRTLGFPTANISLRRYEPPVAGVYVVEVEGVEGGRCWPGVANVGTRPAVTGEACWLEVHLFDFDGDLYGRRLRVSFHRFLRKELDFPDVEALRQQMLKDADQALAWHGEYKHG